MNTTLLPPEHNPFLKNNIYQRLKIDPLATDAEIKAAMGKVSLDDVPADKRKTEMEMIKKQELFLQKGISRVAINALIFDEVDSSMVSERLKNLPNLKTEPIKLPQPDIDQIFMEGKNLEISQQDFQPVEPDHSLEIDLEVVKQLVTEKQEEKIIIFET